MALRLSCVVARAEPVDGHHRLVADDPGVMAARQGGDVARAGDELRAVVHPDRQPAADVVLEVRCRTAVGAGDRLHVAGPAPSGLEHQPPDLAARSEEHTSELQSRLHLVCRLLLEKKKKTSNPIKTKKKKKIKKKRC